MQMQISVGYSNLDPTSGALVLYLRGTPKTAYLIDVGLTSTKRLTI